LTFFIPFILALSVLFIPTVREYISSGLGSNEWGRSALYIIFTIAYSLGMPFIVASFTGGIHALAYLNRGGIFLICYALVPLLCLLAISPFLNVAGYYLFFTMPAFLILAALCASEVISIIARNSKALSVSVIMIILFSLIAQSYLYYMVENGGREKWKEAFQSIYGNVKVDDLVIVPMPRIAEYYLQKQNIQQLEKVIGEFGQYKNQWTSKKQDVWFVIDEPSLKVLDNQQRFREWLYANCHLVNEFSVYARVMDRTIRVWHLAYVEPR
jgi:mannosyltransferase